MSKFIHLPGLKLFIGNNVAHSPNSSIQAGFAISKLPSKQKPLPRKSILKRTNSEVYIHPEIEWNADKKYLRDPIVTQKVIDARKQHIKKVLEECTKEHDESSESSTDSEKDAQ